MQLVTFDLIKRRSATKSADRQNVSVGTKNLDCIW